MKLFPLIKLFGYRIYATNKYSGFKFIKTKNSRLLPLGYILIFWDRDDKIEA